MILCFSNLWTSAILDVEVRMKFKLKNNHLSWFVILNLLERNTSFVFLALIATEIWYFIFFLKCVGGHFEYHTLSE